MATNVKKNRNPKESNKIPSTKGAAATAATIAVSMMATTTTDTCNEIPLPGSNISRSANSVTMGTTTKSRATQEENHVVPTFSTGKYSASMSTAFGANLLIIQ